MTYENLIYEVRDSIAYITFNRPKVLNALDRRRCGTWPIALRRGELDDAVRVLIVTGAGEKAFIAGADIDELGAADAG